MNASWIAVQVTRIWRVAIRLGVGIPLEIFGTKKKEGIYDKNISCEASAK